ncbi:MAG: hypothetical protein F4W92_08910 [Gammaproteobacteria bacterium]|nr:hypothetical protein [Gammaproteobacteria bacterium]
MKATLTAILLLFSVFVCAVAEDEIYGDDNQCRVWEVAPTEETTKNHSVILDCENSEILFKLAFLQETNKDTGEMQQQKCVFMLKIEDVDYKHKEQVSVQYQFTSKDMPNGKLRTEDFDVIKLNDAVSVLQQEITLEKLDTLSGLVGRHDEFRVFDVMGSVDAAINLEFIFFAIEDFIGRINKVLGTDQTDEAEEDIIDATSDDESSGADPY